MPEPAAADGIAEDREGLERALELAYRSLSTRERTVAEMRALLDRRGIPQEVAESALEELQAAGALDDRRYAERYAADKADLERWGADRIERELAHRGVADELIEEALAGLDRDRQSSAAAALLTERFPARLDDDRERDRAWRALVRKGYAPELAYEAVRTHWRSSIDSLRH